MIVPIYFGTSFLMIYPPHFFSFLHGFCSGAEAWTIPRVVRKPSCRWMLAAGCCRLNVSKNHSRIIRGSSKHQRSCLNLNSTFFCPAPSMASLKFESANAAGPAILAQLWGACHRQWRQPWCRRWAPWPPEEGAWHSPLHGMTVWSETN